MSTFAEKAIVDYRYRLLTKENKLPFSVSVSVCGKHAEICRFRFPLAQTKGNAVFQ
jgi:hypothetical protein